MELKVESMQLPEKIGFNFEELKSEISATMKTYESMIYTDEQIIAAKKDRATLNSFKKALNDKRIEIEKEYMKPFDDFRLKVNELITIIGKPVSLIDNQIKDFEEQQKKDKLQRIRNKWDSYGYETVSFEKIFDEKWLNASVSEKKISEAMEAKITAIENELAVIDKLPDFPFEARQKYLERLSLPEAIAKVNRLLDEAKMKVEWEKKKAEQEQIRAEHEAKKSEAEELPFTQEEPILITLKLMVTPAQEQKLRAFLAENDIEEF